MSLARPRVLLCGCLLLACTAPAPAPEQPPPPAEPAAPPRVEVVVKAETPPDPAPSPAAEPAPLSLDTPIGVEACDAYVGRYRTCIADQVPAGEKDRHTKVLMAQLANWLAAKADPKLAPALDGECAAASEAARVSTRAIGCVWREGDTNAPELPKGGTLKPETRMVPRGLPGDPFGELE